MASSPLGDGDFGSDYRRPRRVGDHTLNTAGGNRCLRYYSSVHQQQNNRKNDDKSYGKWRNSEIHQHFAHLPLLFLRLGEQGQPSAAADGTDTVSTG
jgi:hypothetical protein